MSDLTYQCRSLTTSLEKELHESNGQEILLINELLTQKKTHQEPLVISPWMLLLLKKYQILKSEHEEIEGLISYLTSVKYDFLYELRNVALEQIDFSEQSYSETCSNFSYVEILRHQRPVISMIVCNLSYFHLQTHFFIKKNLFTMIAESMDSSQFPKVSMSYPVSILLHLYALSLFGNQYMYTSPVGDMLPILKKYQIPYQTLPRNFDEPEQWRSKYGSCVLWTLGDVVIRIGGRGVFGMLRNPEYPPPPMAPFPPPHTS